MAETGGTWTEETLEDVDEYQLRLRSVSVAVADLDNLSWSLVSKQLVAAGILQVVLLLLSLPMHRLWMNPRSPLRLLRATHELNFGTRGEMPQKRAVFTVFVLFQFLFSFTTIVLWIHKTYVRKLLFEVEMVERAASAFFIVHYLMNILKNTFAWSFFWSFESLVEVITIPALIMQGQQQSWISFSFLRSWRLLQAYYRLEAHGVMDNVSDLKRGMIVGAINFFTLIFMISATQFVLEVLGPIEGYDDVFLETSMGHVSMWQMSYWMITTISTVGYGDFSPTTLLSRMFTAVAIAAGVVFFTVQSGNVYALKLLEDSGRGEFRARRRDRGHVVVTGGAVAANASVVLHAFLNELLKPSRGAAAPEVVVLGHNKLTENTSNLLAEAWCKKHCKFLRGTPLSKTDLARAHTESAEMVFVLANIFTATPDAEDEQNILCASSMLKNHPNLPLRVMLLRPESRQMALNLGLDMNICFAINEWKANMLSQSFRVEGFITLVLNLTRKSDELPLRVGGTLPPSTKPDTWEEDFMSGAATNLEGWLVPEELAGKTFHEAASVMYLKFHVYMLGVQIDGKVQLNPQSDFRLKHGDVAFLALTEGHKLHQLSPDDRSPLAKGEKPRWVQKFLMQRMEASSDIRHKQQGSLIDSAWDAEDPGLKGVHEMWHHQLEATGHGRTHVAHRRRVASEEDRLPRSEVRFTEDELVKQVDMEKANTKRGNPNKERRFPAKGKMHILNAPQKRVTTSRKLVTKHHPEEESAVQEERDTAEVLLSKPSLTSLTEDHSQGLDEVLRSGDHYVVILLAEDLWQQLTAMLAPLRSAHLHRLVPVVVLSRYRAPAWMRDKFPLTFWVMGNPFHVRTLSDEVGIHTAKCIVLVMGPPLRSEPVLMDQHMVLTASLVEARLASCRTDIPVVIEMHDPYNVSQLVDDVPLCLHRHFPVFVEHQQQQAHWLQELAVKCGGLFWPRRANEQLPMQRGIKGKYVATSDTPFYHPRYTAGRVMTRVDLCSIFATAFYTPGVMEVLEAMTMPGTRGQDSFIFLQPVPFGFVGKTFGELYAQCIEDKVLLLGVLRSIQYIDNPMPYVLTFPQPGQILDKGDQIYVQSSEKWSRARNAAMDHEKVAVRVLQWHWRAFMQLAAGVKKLKQRKSANAAEQQNRDESDLSFCEVEEYTAEHPREDSLPPSKKGL